jgi:hypothetical protein
MPSISPAVSGLEGDLREIFGERFESLVVYGSSPTGTPTTTLAIVTTLAADDLLRCARKAASWHDAGLATPLLLGAHEFDRSLDAFPFEFGSIIAEHTVVSGRNPFEGVAVDPSDLRRACEVQARSHLLHLREGYVETRGRSDAVAQLIVRSAPAFAALLKSVARLGGGGAPQVPPEVGKLSGGATQLSSSEAVALFPAYLAVVEQLVRFVDQWSTAR